MLLIGSLFAHYAAVRVALNHDPIHSTLLAVAIIQSKGNVMDHRLLLMH